MELRSYQQDIINEVDTYIKQNKKRISVVLPAGCGVTMTACVIANEILKDAVVIIRTLDWCKSFKELQEKLYPGTNVLIASVNKFRLRQGDAFEPRTELIGKKFLLLGATPNERKLLKEVIPVDSTVVCIGSIPLFKNYSNDILNIETMIGYVFYATELFDVRDVLNANIYDSHLIVHQIETKQRENAEYIKMQKSMRDSYVKSLEEKIYFLESLICSAGISLDTIEDYLSKTMQKKASLSERIENGDESALEELSSFIADYSRKLFAPYVTEFNKQYYDSTIGACLTEPVWNKMAEESRSCVITSKVAYESLQKADPEDTMDYSGICILASKALDIEISKRFVRQYVDYLKEKKAIEQWPNVFFDKNGELLEDEKFTLGTIQFVVGINESGEIKNYYVYNMFCEYARNRLYTKSLNNSELKAHLTKCVQCVEKVRNDYRNPAAHRTALNSITAKECLDYLIDTYKKMKEILIYMK
jgi:hypothetical protein